MAEQAIILSPGDALLVVDVQRDFLPGGQLAVERGDAVVAPLNRYIEAFQSRGLPIYATRDWHPASHCSFREQGGPWPPHCIADSDGAAFAPGLRLPTETVVISKATGPKSEAYSGFEGTDLAARLRSGGVSRVFVGGLATDYCVLNTVRDALREGFTTYLLEDAIQAVNVSPGDGTEAIESMLTGGANPIRFQDLAAPADPH